MNCQLSGSTELLHSHEITSHNIPTKKKALYEKTEKHWEKPTESEKKVSLMESIIRILYKNKSTRKYIPIKPLLKSVYIFSGIQKCFILYFVQWM